VVTNYSTSKVTTIVTGSQCSALSEVACRESTRTVAPRIRCFCIRIRGATVRVEKIGVLAYFGRFLQILPQLKNFFENSKFTHHSRTRRHLCAKFDLLGLLSPEMSFGEQTATHPPRHSAYFATSVNLSAPHWGKCSTPRNKFEYYFL